MKRKNKQSGEINEFSEVMLANWYSGQISGITFDSIKELTDEWEDVELK